MNMHVLFTGTLLLLPLNIKNKKKDRGKQIKAQKNYSSSGITLNFLDLSFHLSKTCCLRIPL